MKNKVRFAPSPTGHVHIGNIRTAIFNWLFARSTDGEFLVRVEDTDKERSTKAAIDTMLESLNWLEISYTGEIYYQSQHENEHVEIVKNFIKDRKAYYKPASADETTPVLFRIPMESDNYRAVGNSSIELHSEHPVEIDITGVKFFQLTGKGKALESSSSFAGLKGLKIYDSTDTLLFDLNKNYEEIISNNKKFTLEKCSKMEFEKREVFFKDLIKGELAKPLDSMKDLIILRSDGSPVFHVANVCDDVKQGITHIIRGDDHVENTYRHILLFEALGGKIPSYGHMPMIVNKQGKPYSKRDGDAFVGDFRTKGYLPEALFNYLSLLGWSPGNDLEKMSKDDEIKYFSLDRVKSSPAQFDMVKLNNMNGMYMAEIPSDIFFEKAHETACCNGWGNIVDKDKFKLVTKLMQSRTKFYTQVDEWKYFFFPNFYELSSPEIATIETKNYFSYDKNAIKKTLKDKIVIPALNYFADEIIKIDDLNVDAINKLIDISERQFAIQEGHLKPSLRALSTGCSNGADLSETINLLGKELLASRIKLFLSIIEEF